MEPCLTEATVRHGDLNGWIEGFRIVAPRWHESEAKARAQHDSVLISLRATTQGIVTRECQSTAHIWLGWVGPTTLLETCVRVGMGGGVNY